MSAHTLVVAALFTFLIAGMGGLIFYASWTGREKPRDGEPADGEEERRRAGPATGQAGDVQLAA